MRGCRNLLIHPKRLTPNHSPSKSKNISTLVILNPPINGSLLARILEETQHIQPL